MWICWTRSSRRVWAALALLGNSGLVTALDLLELAPRHDQDGQTAEPAIALLTGFLEGGAPAPARVVASAGL